MGQPPLRLHGPGYEEPPSPAINLVHRDRRQYGRCGFLPSGDFYGFSTSLAAAISSAIALPLPNQTYKHQTLATKSSAMETPTLATKPKPLPLPKDMLVEIAGQVAATSPHPMKDICSLAASYVCVRSSSPCIRSCLICACVSCSCQDMFAACKEGAVGRRVALEREGRMRWLYNDCYNALADNLVATGNPQAFFVRGLTLVFAKRCMPLGTESLRQAASAGHKVAAYVLGVLHYSFANKQKAEWYIRQVEGEGDVVREGDVMRGSKQARGRTNRECVTCRAHAVEAVRDITWNVTGAMGPLLAPALPAEDGQGCSGLGCGVPEGWTHEIAVFCSEGCRIRHEFSEFFSLVVQ